ncbi:MAG TPA: autotransporter-associated beta strand repeat-containing protein, partial [Gemmataceae bacterium]
FTGNIFINGNRFSINTNTAINSVPATATIVVNGTSAGGGQLYANTTATTNFPNPIFLSGTGWSESVANGSYGALRMKGWTITGPVTLIGNARIGGNNNFTMSGPISGPFEAAFALGATGATGSNTVTLTNANNTYSGGTRIERGVVRGGVTNALPVGTVVTFGSPVLSGGFQPASLAVPQLDLGGFDQTIGGLTVEPTDNVANGTSSTATAMNSGAAKTLTINTAGNFSFAGAITGATVNLVKTGPGTQTLTGANTFTGTTTVTGGVLALASATSNNTIPSSAVTVAPGGALNVAGITAAGGFTVGATQTLTDNGTVTGDVTVPAGATLTGAGTYAGNVTVSGGTLTPGTATTVGTMAAITGNLSVTGPNQFKIKVSGAAADQITTVTGTASFAGNSSLSVAQLGAPTSPSYTILASTGGITGLTAGPLTSIGRTNYAIDAAALAANSLKLDVTGGPANMRWVGGAATNPNRWENTRLDANWTTADPVADATHYYDGDFVRFDNTATTFTVNVTGTVTPGSVTVANTGGTTYTFADGGSGAIAGNTGLSMTSDGTGTLVIGTHNTFTGPVSVTNGIVSVSSADNLGAANNTLTLAGGTLRATASLDLGATRAVTLAAGGGTFDVSASATLTVSGVVSGAGATDALTKTGAGTLVPSGANTYNGPTNISAGTLRVTNSASLGAVPGGAVTVAAGGILDLGAGGTANALNFGQKQFVVAGDGDGTTGAITNSAAVNQQNALQRVRLSADASVGGANRFDIRAGQVNNANTAQLDLAGHTLTKNGSFFFPLVGVDVTDGNVVVNGGTLSFETSTNVPAGTGTVTFNAGTTWSFFGFTGTLARPITLNGAVKVGPNNNAISAATSPITLNGDLTATSINANSTGTAALLGPIGETGGPHSITKINSENATSTGTSVLALGGNNTFSGGVNFNSGIVEISAVNNLGTGPLTFDGGALRFAAGSGGADVSVRPFNMPGGATIDTNGNSVTFANPIGNGGAGGLTKAGAGTLNLTAANTYTGGTSVTGGTLRVNNASGTSATGTGPVTVTGTGAVGSGGTLGGNGFIAGTVTVSSTVAAQQGGTVSPGNSIGTLTVGGMSWQPNGSYLFEYKGDPATFAGGTPLAGTDNDTITSAGPLDLSGLNPGTFTLNLVPVNSPTSTPPAVTYTLGTFAGGVNGSGGPIAPGTDVSNLFSFTGSFASTPVVTVGNGGAVTVAFQPSPVPEPAFILLTCGAAAGGLWWRRRTG